MGSSLNAGLDLDAPSNLAARLDFDAELDLDTAVDLNAVRMAGQRLGPVWMRKCIFLTAAFMPRH